MNIAIAGYGVEGQANYNYWNTPGNELTIVDANEQLDSIPEGARTILGPDAFSQLEGFDVVVRTASLAPGKIKTDGRIWSATNEFFEKCPAPIIGVTGSKGKGTTSSFITSMLRAAGKAVHLVGNIGVPALAELTNITANDVVVYELSSFQLWDAQQSPHVAVVLPVEADHLDVHEGMDDYVAAKANIARHQSSSDVLVYSPHNEISTHIAQQSAGRCVAYTKQESSYVQDGYFYYQATRVCPTAAVQLPGQHNLDNACAAIAAVVAGGFLDAQSDGIERGLRAFEGLDHRLKFVGEVAEVRYYDDSIATTPGSAIAALRSFAGPKIIILGGSDKGGDYAQIVEECARTDTYVVAIGETGPRIAELCREASVPHEYVQATAMHAIVERIHQIASPGMSVILSPASASFGMFKNYADRGDQFIAAVHSL